MGEWHPPEGHPISAAKAKELMGGKLRDVYRDILRKCCLPIYWFRLEKKPLDILHNGTLTLVRTPKRLLGVTALHVFKAYERDRGREKVRLQLMNTVVDDFSDRVIATSEKLDLVTVAIDENLADQLKRQKELVPLGSWPPKAPAEGRGIMLAGYPARDRQHPGPMEVNFGMFTALGIARTVTETQITWLVEREYHLEGGGPQDLPRNYDLGGISGGPLISWFESENHVSHHFFSAIVTEHPDYAKNELSIERVIAVRADPIGENGKIY